MNANMLSGSQHYDPKIRLLLVAQKKQLVVFIWQSSYKSVLNGQQQMGRAC